MGLTKYNVNTIIALVTLVIVWYVMLSRDTSSTSAALNKKSHTSSSSSFSSNKDLSAFTFTIQSQHIPSLPLIAPVGDQAYYIDRTPLLKIIMAWSVKNLLARQQLIKQSTTSVPPSHFVDVGAKSGGFAVFAATVGVNSINSVFTSPTGSTDFAKNIARFSTTMQQLTFLYSYTLGSAEFLNTSRLLHPPSTNPSGMSDGTTLLKWTLSDVTPNGSTEATILAKAVHTHLQSLSPSDSFILMVDSADSTSGTTLSSILPPATPSSPLKCIVIAPAASVCPLVSSASSMCFYGVRATHITDCLSPISYLPQCPLIVTTANIFESEYMECSKQKPQEFDPTNQLHAALKVKENSGTTNTGSENMSTLKIIFLSAPALVGVVLLWNICKNWRGKSSGGRHSQRM